MSKSKKIKFKDNVLDLVNQIRLAYPILKEEEIDTLEDVKKWFLQLDLLANSDLLKTVFLNLSDSLLKLSRKEKNNFCGDLVSSDTNLRNSFHEILVGNFFQNLGFSVKFQPKYEIKRNNNPDWEIEKNEQKAIVEVFTLNKYEDYKHEQSITFLLFNRLRKLEKKYDITLDIDRSSINIKEIVNDGIIKSLDKIINNVDSWLQFNLENMNDNRIETSYGIIVIVLSKKAFSFNQKWSKPGGKSTRLSDHIIGKKGKYQKYQSLIKKEEKSFIIICVTDCLMTLKLDKFKEIIFGINSESSLENKESVINEQRKLEEVSVFILIDYNPDNLYQPVNVNIQKNPFAKYPFDLTDIINVCAKANNFNSLFYK